MKKVVFMLTAALLLGACGQQTEEHTAHETEQQAENTTTVVMYNRSTDEGGTALAGEELDYSYQKDGSLTQFLLTKLEYMPYVKDYAVSQDEKTVTINFKEEVMNTNIFQGSTGAAYSVDAIGKTFFKNMPKLETLKLRKEGEKQEMDHMRFDDYSKADFDFDKS